MLCLYAALLENNVQRFSTAFNSDHIFTAQYAFSKLLFSLRLQRKFAREVSEAAGRTLAEGKRRRKPIRGWVFLRFVLFRYLLLLKIKLVSPFLHEELFKKVCAGSWYVYFRLKTYYLIQFQKCRCQRSFKSNQRVPCVYYRNPMLSTVC